ncbi:MAG: hypothetical protein RDV48_05590 [Candidatus Eremiobacteraeota bacterium]|nr:hypothetical protein [Candidatus Eremiobacteraeota bacterium]
MREIYRKEALQKLTSPEQLDQCVTIVSSRGWLALAASGVLILFAILWLIFGRIPITISGEGMLLGMGEMKGIIAGLAGTIECLPVKQGDRVTRDQVLARVRRTDSSGGDAFEIKSPMTGILVSLPFDEGNFIRQEETFGTVQAETSEIDAVIFISMENGKLVTPGMDILISPSTVNRQDFGFIYGKVAGITEFPVTRAEVMRKVHNETLAEICLKGTPKIGIRAIPTRDASTVSGYKWSSGRGPAIKISNVTPCSATVILKTVTPLSLMLPVRF